MAQTLPDNFPPPETAGDQTARLAWERARLDEAYDDIANGRVIKDEELDAWLDAWVSGRELPPTSAD